MTVWLKLSEKDLQLSAVFVVTVFFQGKRSRRDLKFSTQVALEILARMLCGSDAVFLPKAGWNFRKGAGGMLDWKSHGMIAIRFFNLLHGTCTFRFLENVSWSGCRVLIMRGNQIGFDSVFLETVEHKSTACRNALSFTVVFDLR